MAPANVVVTLDVSGLPCPAPLLGAKKVLNDLEVGQAMRLISDCTGIERDLVAWGRVIGDVLVSATKLEDGKDAYVIQRLASAEVAPRPHVMLDMRGVACPGPVIQARRMLEAMKSGEILQLVTDCTVAIDEVPLWCHVTSVEFLLAVEMPGGAQEFYLKRN